MSNGIISILVVSGILQTINAADSCNQNVCGSIVSKCTLQQSCSCKQEDFACLGECILCMSKRHFAECCGCVDLCPKYSNTKNNLQPLSQKSHVEDFEGVPELFDVLVSLPADSVEYSWNILTLPIDLKEVIYKNTHKPDGGDGTVNCTVVYFDNCVSWNKCRQSCKSTGASGYRWFHDGCCECVGSTCINYGVNESRCRHCPEAEEEDDNDLEHLVDYDSDDDDADDFYVIEVFDRNLKDNSI